MSITDWAIAAVAVLAISASAGAQPPAPAPAEEEAQTAAAAPAPPAQEDDPDQDINFAQPDFTLAALPTTLRVPRHKSAFRVTHRFARPLGQGDFGDLAEDLFGLDGGALIGLEYRYGVFRRTQVGFHRTAADKTIQLFAQREVLSGDDFWFTLDAFGSVEGTNNLRDHHSPAIGAILSREIGEHAAFYVAPFWVNNTNPLPEELADDNSTFVVGLGARVRIRPTVYLVVEGAPRVGFDPGVAHVSFGIEKRAGGHLFQLNFSNSFGTTFAQMARGGLTNDDWYLGFNISRKFF